MLSGEQHSIERDRQAITYHYDVSNDFYALWLDQQMVYSCAYFETSEEDLDTAQTRKLEYLCRKLRLRSGERLLDIGCGWGALAVYAARHYDVQVLGIALSQNQADLANQRLAQAGLQNQCRVELRDYRSLNELGGFDKLVSVGIGLTLERHRDQALAAVGDPTYRVWRLYLRGSNYGFASGALNLYQTLLVKPDQGRSGVPLTRRDWYRDNA
jgi:cyclopropane fatty-acyl-phospholipid synthase-like methyltransferase